MKLQKILKFVFLALLLVVFGTTAYLLIKYNKVRNIIPEKNTSGENLFVKAEIPEIVSKNIENILESPAGSTTLTKTGTFVSLERAELKYKTEQGIEETASLNDDLLVVCLPEESSRTFSEVFQRDKSDPLRIANQIEWINSRSKRPLAEKIQMMSNVILVDDRLELGFGKENSTAISFMTIYTDKNSLCN